MRHGRGKPAPLPRHPERSRARRDRNQDRVHRRNGPRPAHRQPLLRVAGPQAASARSATAVCRACPRDHAAGTGTAVMKASDEDREGLRQTFNQAAGSYQRARPDYPGELFDDLVTVAGLAPGDRLLEIGCATGKATFPLARRGFQVTCIELGADLAALARRNLDGPGVEVIEGRFEGLAAGRRAAVRPGLRRNGVELDRSRPPLRPGLAGATTRRPPRLLERPPRVPRWRRPLLPRDPGRLRRDREGLPPGSTWPRPGELADQAAEIEAVL